MLLTIDGAIGPATDDYIERVLEAAASHRAELVVIRMDTPGGLDSVMRGIIKDAVAYIRSLAEFHGRNQDWAEKAGERSNTIVFPFPMDLVESLMSRINRT